MYFLFIAALQLIPGLSPTSWVTTVAPLCFVLFINGVKEIADDLGRHRSDAQINNAPAVVLRGREEVHTQWRHVQIGDVVKVYRDSQIPADVVFLSSSDKDDLCYVETANLDGETNLKLKYCYPGTKLVASGVDLKDFAAGSRVECEKPNEKLYVFEGSVRKSGGGKDALDVANLLLRGCTLRNTDWVTGLVVFAGFDSKIFKNRVLAPRKVTQLEQNMNILVALMFALQLTLAFLGAIGSHTFYTTRDAGAWYLGRPGPWPELMPGFGEIVVSFLRFGLLINQLIPISLYVTLEVVKVVQCTFLSWDRQMYHAETDSPFQCRTSTLNEELGQVEYVLSDKTGTLTQNVMGFVWCTIDGKLYGKQSNAQGTPHTISGDTALLLALQRKGSPEHQAAVAFLTHLAICNTVVPATNAQGELPAPSLNEGGVAQRWALQTANTMCLQAASPDEEALVQGAATLGFRLVTRSLEKVGGQAAHAARGTCPLRHVSCKVVLGELLTLEVIAVLEFNSDRKRMSIIIRMPGGRVRIFCKGADSMIYARVAPGQPVADATSSHLAEMSRNGFRTLCMGQRDVEPAEFQEWHQRFHEASVSLKGRDEKIAKVAEEIERDFKLLGATAVEDRLQDGVPEAIALLSKAGIKVWVLTGDKLETAISISLSCRLFHNSMKLMMLREHDLNDGKDGAVSEALLIKALEARKVAREGANAGSRGNLGLVIEGGALAQALHRQNANNFLELCKSCHAVVCCRVTPMQKAQVVSLVKHHGGAITLGIGDGANDVGMIQAAHIGVGISGREGRAAVLASDFAFAQFQYLTRLLLVHGRWSYKRNSEVVMYAFYKNFAYCLPNCFFAVLSGFSAQPLYTSAIIATFNVLWTAWPTIAFAALEQATDVSAKNVMAHPQLYMETMNMDRRRFFALLSRWLLEGLWHGLVCFFAPLLALGRPRRDGTVDGLPTYGVATYTAVILIVNLKVAMRSYHLTAINLLLIFGLSIGCWFPALWGLSTIPQLEAAMSTMIGIAPRLYSNVVFWLTVGLAAPVIALMSDFLRVAFERQFCPQDHQIFQASRGLGELGRLGSACRHAWWLYRQHVVPGARGPACCSHYAQVHSLRDI
eukprot:jgi/Astpho2/6425/e_gw1.00093.28.1_t